MHYNWETIYKKYGIIQKEPIPCVVTLGNLLSKSKKKQLTILDVGCGTGRHILYLHSVLPNAHIVGFDPSEKGIEILRSIVSDEKNISLFIHDMDKPYHFTPNKFDAIVSSLVIHHGYWHEVKKRFDDSVFLLKKGGLLVFACPSTRDPRYNTGTTAKDGTKLNTAQKDGFLPHYFMDRTKLESLFHGFKIISITEIKRPMVTAKGTAVNWEVVASKK